MSIAERFRGLSSMRGLRARIAFTGAGGLELVGLVGGIALATGLVDTNGHINACVNNQTGVVRLVPSQLPAPFNTSCNTSTTNPLLLETPLQWNQIGPAGPTGPQGPAGLGGATGPAGPAGAPGAKGDAGPAGPIGASGPPGPSGQVGPQGPQGLKGDTGAAGPQGPAGASGPAGQGVTGIAEPAGANCAGGGVKYTDGGGTVQFVCNGVTGSQGPIGPAGPQGPAGTSTPANASNTTAGLVALLPSPCACPGLDFGFTDIASTSLTIPTSANGHLVLMVGQLGFNPNGPTNIAYRVTLDGTVVDGPYVSNAPEGEVTVPMSRVMTLLSGPHTAVLQGKVLSAATLNAIRGLSLSLVDLGQAP